MQIQKGGKNPNKHPRQVIEYYLELGSDESPVSTVTVMPQISLQNIDIILWSQLKFGIIQ